MAGKEIAVKKYVVRLSAGERENLTALTRAGKSQAQLQRKARILLKADVSEVDEGWSDSAISAALDTSVNNIGFRIGDRGTDREDEPGGSLCLARARSIGNLRTRCAYPVRDSL